MRGFGGNKFNQPRGKPNRGGGNGGRQQNFPPRGNTGGRNFQQQGQQPRGQGQGIVANVNPFGNNPASNNIPQQFNTQQKFPQGPKVSQNPFQQNQQQQQNFPLNNNNNQQQNQPQQANNPFAQNLNQAQQQPIGFNQQQQQQQQQQQFPPQNQFSNHQFQKPPRQQFQNKMQAQIQNNNPFLKQGSQGNQTSQTQANTGNNPFQANNQAGPQGLTPFQKQMQQGGTGFNQGGGLGNPFLAQKPNAEAVKSEIKNLDFKSVLQGNSQTINIDLDTTADMGSMESRMLSYHMSTGSVAVDSGEDQPHNIPDLGVEEKFGAEEAINSVAAEEKESSAASEINPDLVKWMDSFPLKEFFTLKDENINPFHLMDGEIIPGRIPATIP